MKMAPGEIVALARIIEELDYYQLLDLRRDAGAGEVKRAYHNSSRTFHPDANRHLDGELRSASQRSPSASPRPTRCCATRAAARRTTAASRAARAADAARRCAGRGRSPLSQERGGRTPQGRQFFKLAEADIARATGRRGAQPPDRADLRAGQRAVQGAARAGEAGAALISAADPP
jgi:hypothetical protein